MILQLPSTSLSETFGLITQPLPCTRNVYMRVRAYQRASVTRICGKLGETYTLSQKAMQWTIIIAHYIYYKLTQIIPPTIQWEGVQIL